VKITFLISLGFVYHLAVICYERVTYAKKIIISRVGDMETFISYVKEREDKDGLRGFLEEMFLIGRFCLYWVGTDILVC
jgi:hypothetical protein